MSIHKFRNIEPQIDRTVFVASSADIIGRVIINQKANIWYGVVIRGDVNEIHIGENTNVQDLSMLHVAADYPLIIGANVTIGHNVNLHACTIGDNSLIGIGAIVLDGAEIGKGSVVAAGTVVPPGKSFPAKSLIMGSPAKMIRLLTDNELDKYGNHYKGYLNLASEYSDIVE